jgi:hypothetical protein
VCPRHYGHFAERERGRWTALDAPILADAPVRVATAVQPAVWADANRTLDAGAAPVDAAPMNAAVAALGLIDTLAPDS